MLIGNEIELFFCCFFCVCVFIYLFIYFFFFKFKDKGIAMSSDVRIASVKCFALFTLSNRIDWPEQNSVDPD